MLDNLYDWQRDCLDRWLANNGRGIVNVVTGAGKTILAAAISALTDAIYHSGMGEQARVNALRRFENRETRILISCKALDEGLNIPETDAGIIVSCTGSNRQRIQRLGRILRRGGNAVGAYMTDSGWPKAKALEVMRNLRLGAVCGDWLLTEDVCRGMAEKAETKAEANYYITMLLMIRAREGRLGAAAH